MRILLDEDVPRQALGVLQHVLRDHHVNHVHLVGWSGKPDKFVYPNAATKGYDAVLTNDARQMADPEEYRAVRRSRIHWISYPHRRPGLKGLAVAVASIIAAMPDIVGELEEADGQRLVTIAGINPRRKRYSIVDPRRDPPPYWGRR